MACLGDAAIWQVAVSMQTRPYCAVLCHHSRPLLLLACLQVAYIDKQLLATASVPGRKVELFRHASVLLASTHQHWLAGASGLPQQQEAYR